jgi:hypothetical protein
MCDAAERCVFGSSRRLEQLSVERIEHVGRSEEAKPTAITNDDAGLDGDAR